MFSADYGDINRRLEKSSFAPLCIGQGERFRDLINYSVSLLVTTGCS